MGFIHKKAPLFLKDAFEYRNDVGKDDAILRECISRDHNDVSIFGNVVRIFIMSAEKNIQNAIVFTAYCRIFCKFVKSVERMTRYFGDVHNNGGVKSAKKDRGRFALGLGN